MSRENNGVKSKKRTRVAIVASAAVILIAVSIAGALSAGIKADNAGQRERQALDAVDMYFAENLPTDPDSAFTGILEVSTEPEKYSKVMSSYPGIYLHVGGRAEGGAITRYECDSGSFATLEDGMITTLGADVERAFGASPRVHWLPAPDTAEGDKIRISLEKDGLREDFVTLSVELDATFHYSLVPDESTDTAGEPAP